MRLPDFIQANSESILREWDDFARSIWPDDDATKKALRDHAGEILQATARDMRSSQSGSQQSLKSKGLGTDGAGGAVLVSASKDHAFGRVQSGFDLVELVAEYRALRASVIRLWSQSREAADPHAVNDLIRFNEAIDQSLTEAVAHFTNQIDQARSIFLGILGHDLRNPLNAIILSVHAMQEIPGVDSESAGLAAQIAASGEAMAGMLSDFLDFTASRLGRGISITPVPMDLGELCREVVAESQAAFPGHHIDLASSGTLTGSWDPGRLRQVLSNLIGNAAQHGDVRSPITVSAMGTESSATLTIHNWGEAIPDTALPRIFDPFVRGLAAEAREKQLPGSMGLGLYIAHEIVTAHGGTLAVESAESRGTLFTATLPHTPPIRRHTSWPQ